MRIAQLIKLPQTITYWLSTGTNGTGGKTWAAGVQIAARISQVHEEFFDNEGKKIWVRQAVYANTSVPVGSYIVEDTKSGVSAPTADARQVIGLSSNSTMTSLNRMMLR
jgi:hypothetical protein